MTKLFKPVLTEVLKTLTMENGVDLYQTLRNRASKQDLSGF